MIKCLEINVEGREIVGRGEAVGGNAKGLPQLTKVPLRDTQER